MPLLKELVIQQTANSKQDIKTVKGVLDGITVIDLSQNLPGPYCTRLLADQGARVIKIESPSKPDFGRMMPRFFQQLNGGKESLALDLKSEAGQQAIHRLATSADIFIESFRPGVVARLGVDYASLSKLNPKLIYCSISGYGQSSELSDVVAHDINLQAMSGLIGFEGRRERGSVEECPIPIADMVTSVYAHSAIVSALLERKTTKRGQFIDMPMADGLAHMVQVWQQTTPNADMLEKQLKQTPLPTSLIKYNPFKGSLEKFASRGILPALPHYGVFKCKGGGHLCVGIVDEAHFWRELCAELGGGLGNFAALNPIQRSLLSQPIRILLAAAFKRKTAEQWYTRLGQELKLPVSLVASSGGAAKTGYLKALSDQGFIRSPLAKTAPNYRVYKLGESNEDVL